MHRLLGLRSAQTTQGVMHVVSTIWLKRMPARARCVWSKSEHVVLTFWYMGFMHGIDSQHGVLRQWVAD